MKVYRVDYSGLWLGGSAVVLAESAEEAIALIQHHPSTIRFEDVTATLITERLAVSQVLYNDNGDY